MSHWGNRERASDLLGLRNAVVVTTFRLYVQTSEDGPVGHAQQAAAERHEDLPEIPVFDVGPAFATETAHLAGRERAYAMLDAATAGVPMFGLRLADAISRRWLSAQHSPYLPELDQLASLSTRPGAYFLNVHYEWGCTTAAKPGMEGTSARLLRALDWNVNGLGRHIVAARIASAFGPWVSLTWPGFTGVLQAMAPGRFAAAINQPTVRKRAGIRTVDWLLSKRDVWRSHHVQPIHLLRRVFEEAPDFAAARRLLEATPICTPAIYTLAGVRASEACIIERRETAARVLLKSACTANEWQTVEWYPGHHSAFENARRLAAMQIAPGSLDLTWLHWPILNNETRLALAADAAQGYLIAQGYEAKGPATRPLELILSR
jgi:hypothetical protein